MYPNEENMIVVPIAKIMKIITSIQVFLITRINFDYEKNGERKAFLVNPKNQYRVYQCGEHGFRAQSLKKWRLLQESKFVSFHG